MSPLQNSPLEKASLTGKIDFNNLSKPYQKFYGRQNHLGHPVRDAWANLEDEGRSESFGLNRPSKYEAGKCTAAQEPCRRDEGVWC